MRAIKIGEYPPTAQRNVFQGSILFQHGSNCLRAIVTNSISFQDDARDSVILFQHSSDSFNSFTKETITYKVVCPLRDCKRESQAKKSLTAQINTRHRSILQRGSDCFRSVTINLIDWTKQLRWLENNVEHSHAKIRTATVLLCSNAAAILFAPFESIFFSVYRSGDCRSLREKHHDFISNTI